MRPYAGPTSTYASSGRLPVGFRTSHVVVCSFDRRGNLLWDNTFVLNEDVTRSELEEAVQPLSLPDGRVVLAYLTPENELHYKCINRSEPGDNDRQVSLLPFSTDGLAPDKILDTSQPDVLPWTAVGSTLLLSRFAVVMWRRKREPRATAWTRDIAWMLLCVGAVVPVAITAERLSPPVSVPSSSPGQRYTAWPC